MSDNNNQIIYLIKVYRQVKGKLVFVENLPYRFVEAPENIVHQMNIMMAGSGYVHVFGIEE